MSAQRILFAAFAAFIAVAVSGTAIADEAAELKKRFRERYPLVVKLKLDGTVGETYEGLLDAVEASSLAKPVDAKSKLKVGDLLAAENADRRALYQMIARQAKTTTEIVAKRNARRNMGKAKPSEFLKLKSGKWVRKRDLKKSAD